MAKIYFKTFGCAVNFSESEVMKGLLQKAQFEVLNKIDEAYCIVVNICTVRGNTTVLKKIRELKREYPFIPCSGVASLPSSFSPLMPGPRP